MVVNAKVVMKRVSEENKAVLKDLEGKVDEELDKSFRGGSVIVVPSLEYDRLPESVKEQFLDQYRAQDWEVTEHESQRDGSTLEFVYRGADLSGGYFNGDIRVKSTTT